MLFHLCELPESNSGDNPFRIDREPPCCSWASPSPSPFRWAASPSEHLRNLHILSCMRSSDPVVGIYASSMGQTLGAIRPELTENHHAAAGLLRLLHRLGRLQVHQNTCASYAHLHALRSSEPAVRIHASSLSRIPGIIRAELAEILYHVETDPVRCRLALRSIRRSTDFGRIGAQ